MARLSGRQRVRDGKLSFSQEWVWAAVIAAGSIIIPLLIYGFFEMMAGLRRRRQDAIARRSKGPPRAPGSRVRSDRGA